jgi:broad specificity phosphatase PhoE
MLKHVTDSILIGWRYLCFYTPFMRWLLGMPIQVVLIRHAQSQRNAALRGLFMPEDAPEDQKAIGDTPDHRIQLTSEGWRQARATGAHLVQYVGRPNEIVHSEYVRTEQTLAGILEGIPNGRSIPVHGDSRLRERKTGYTYSMTEQEKQTHFPFNDKYWEITGPVVARPQGGESLLEIKEGRLNACCRDLWKRFAGKRLWLVCHGRVIQCLRALLDEMSLQQMEQFVIEDSKLRNPKNASATIYEYSPRTGRLVLKEYTKTFYKEQSE